MTAGNSVAARLLTPVLLTSNEEANLERTLRALTWASEVIIVDSGSSDASKDIAAMYPNTVWHTRRFDTHAGQWRYAICDSGVRTEYALALDADMVVSPVFVTEAEHALRHGKYAGGIVPFDYCVGGCRLPGSIYRPQLRVFRPREVEVSQVGHTQQFDISGPTYRFHNRVVHDDRKPIERWAAAQVRYSLLEHERILRSDTHGFKDWLRICGVMPVVAAISGYIRAGGPMGGQPALRYAFERLTFESLLSIRLLSGSSPRNEDAG